MEEVADDQMEIDDSIEETQIIENLSSNVSGDLENASNGSLTKTPSEDVVVLDDDEEENSRKYSGQNKNVQEYIDLVPDAINSICINYACKSGKEFIDAPVFCLSYYRVNSKTKKAKKVCIECYELAVKMYDKLTTELKSGRTLSDFNYPLINDMVEIEDSDEEDEKLEPLSERNFDFISENIDAVINELVIKFDLGNRCKRESAKIRERLLHTEDACKEIANELKEMRKNVDEIQQQFYNEFRPVVNETSSILSIIDDHSISSHTIAKEINNPTSDQESSNLPVAQRKSARSSVKQISYNENELSNNILKAVKNKDSQSKAEEPQEEIAVPEDLPPVGPLVKPPLELNQIYYISRQGNNTGCWLRARLMLVLPKGSTWNGQVLVKTMYRMVELKKQTERIVNGKNIAYFNPCPTRLKVGDRVIAVFNEPTNSSSEPQTLRTKRTTNPFYPGIIGEPPYAANKYRYLVFLDIGYAQYVPYDMVHVIYEASDNAWEDMPPDSQPFIKKHCQSQDWPMVKLKRDQSIICEYKGKWHPCTVIDVDCSLVQVFFEELNRFEWIYRGSRRIKEIFRQEMAAANRAPGQRTSRKPQADSKNLVQYTPNVNYSQEATIEAPPVESQPAVRAVAKKSTTKVQTATTTAVPFLPSMNKNYNSMGPISKIMYFTPRDQHTMKRPYRPHNCSPRCRDFITHNIIKLKGQNPLSKPLLCGWIRMTVRVRGRKDIIYKAPCGRLLRNIAEVHLYLSTTRSDMTVDLFDFNHMVRCLAEFSVDCDPDPKDLSKGLEQVAIPVINGINNEMLDFCNYSTKRVPMEGVNMNLDSDFLVSCDCEDDCIDKTKCNCWKLTLEGSNFFDTSLDPNSVGYIYRRLLDQVVTGIFECNQRCKCRHTCLNRVAQNPMSLKLQVFRTVNRGWGIRCLNDVPQGTFICVYAGTIHTDQRANEDGLTFGDEYFAELDFIETTESFKEDYEKDVRIDEEDQLSEKSRASPVDESLVIPKSTIKKKYEMDDNDYVAHVSVSKDKVVETRQKRRKPQSEINMPTPIQIKKEMMDVPISERLCNINIDTSDIDTVTISDDEDEVREVLSFNPEGGGDVDDKLSDNSVRKRFGRDENIYIMDAKNAGNIGRFLNHSCTPNVFVQNVFIDTHDPRFPWAAFFSSQFIRAGTELTWNYNYDVGSVPGKVVYCYCGSLECKGRLL